jgi:hypothetical protein
MKLRISLVLALALLLPLSLFAKCPISPNGRLELRVPAGNLQVETTGTDSVEVEVSNRQVVVQETCEKDKVTVTGKAPTSIGIPDWKIRIPRNITIDLSTQGGNIQVPDIDGEALLRTSGGKVITGNIKGSALFLATEVRAGNIGGNAEVRGLGGRLQIGDVGGDAEFNTKGGDITAGIVKGSIKAEMESGSFSVRESSGNVIVTTVDGDITSQYVRGFFDGKTDVGNIRLEKVGSWVKAATGLGDIFLRLVPTNINGDLHVNAVAAMGDITMYVPKAMKASFDLVVEKPALSAKSILWDIPIKAPIAAVNNLIPGGREKTVPGGPERQTFSLNSGGNSIKLRAGRGTIRIMQGN